MQRSLNLRYQYLIGVVFLLASWPSIFSEVLIITHHYNRPDFIEIQHKTFKHFLKDDYRLVIFNDASEQNMVNQINDTCSKLGIECIRIEQEIHTRPYLPREPNDRLHSPNIRHANVVQYSFDTLAFDHQGIVLLLDSDMFLIRPLNITELMKDCDIRAVMRGAEKIDYIWPGFSIFNMNKLPNKKTLNFNFGLIDGKRVDSGGYTYFYLKDNPSVKIKIVDELWSYQLFCQDRFVPAHVLNIDTPYDQQIKQLLLLGFNDKEIKFLQKKPDTIEFLLDKHFLHYRCGTNYDKQSEMYNVKKMHLINEFLLDILKD